MNSYNEYRKYKASIRSHYRDIFMCYMDDHPIEQTEAALEGWYPIRATICKLGYNNDQQNALNKRINFLAQQGCLEIRYFISSDISQKGRLMKHVYLPAVIEALSEYRKRAATKREVFFESNVTKDI